MTTSQQLWLWENIMDFYVSWYPGDPQYPLYDENCSMLISVASVSQTWTVNRLERLPCRLIIDSGGFRFATNPKEALPPQKLFQRQLQLLANQSVPTVICARDYPIIDPKFTSNQKDYCITQTIAYAYELKEMVTKQRLPLHVKTMAIIQGDDEDSLIYCANELNQIGFDMYGIGSMAVLKRHAPIIKRVKAVTTIIPPDKLHIFGVSVIKTGQALAKMGVHSIDSSRPAKAAAYNEILYSNPYRRLGILEPPEVPIAGRIPKHRRLSKPLPCNCPVCRNGGDKILGVGHREFIRARALHNYYHLKRLMSENIA